jgi:hypothetical protein
MTAPACDAWAALVARLSPADLTDLAGRGAVSAEVWSPPARPKCT